jgi:hypothetical protein
MRRPPNVGDINPTISLPACLPARHRLSLEHVAVICLAIYLRIYSSYIYGPEACMASNP